MNKANLQFLEKPIPLKEQSWPKGTLPMVATSTLTFNHAPFIRECLEGILMQKTTFPVKVVIFDDCSTDGTREIIKEYEAKFPNIIKGIYPKNNTYQKPERKEALKPYLEARGIAKYIALCEGDDYWTDPLKLQKQVRFLEKNKSYSLCFTKAEVKNEQGVSEHYTSLYDHLQNKDYSSLEIYSKWTIPTASVVFRTPKLYDIPIDNRFIYGDIVLFLWLSRKGKIRCLNESMVVYRRNLGGATFQKRDYNKVIAHHRAILEHFGEKYKYYSDSIILNIYINTFLAGRLNKMSFSVVNDVCRQPHLIFPFIVKTPVRLIHVLKYKCTN